MFKTADMTNVSKSDLTMPCICVDDSLNITCYVVSVTNCIHLNFVRPAVRFTSTTSPKLDEIRLRQWLHERSLTFL